MPKSRVFLSMTKSFFEHDPVAAAKHLEAMDTADAITVLKNLPPNISANVVRHLQVDQAVSFLQGASPELFREITSKLEPQQIAAFFLLLPDNVKENLLSNLSEKNKHMVKELLTFPEDSAGRIMSTNYIALRPELKVKDAIKKIRALAKKKGPASYVYVADSEKCLVGVINMRDMMLASGESDLGSVMNSNIFAVDAFMDREEVADKLSEKRYFAVPVVDAQNRMLGIIRSESLIEHVQEEASEDIQKMFGAGGDERAFSPAGFSIKKRLPWLHINLATAFMAAFVVSIFEDIIAKVTILAVFLPVVAGQGGNAGAQSLAVVMRGLVMREIPADKAGKMILKETLIGLVNGIIIGIVTGLIAWLWYKNPFLGIVIGLAMIINLVVAGLAGAAIPLVMKKIGFDPAQSSNIILTTVTDVLGFFAFLGLAVVFKNYLI